jgi:hypothetical protein
MLLMSATAPICGRYRRGVRRGVRRGIVGPLNDPSIAIKLAYGLRRSEWIIGKGNAARQADVGGARGFMPKIHHWAADRHSRRVRFISSG